ncbi:hypothetical protein Ae201684_008720 [Aphanomyces euteiches]|uniref:CCHC-type domain-containing protein n=1 Tax=Aphanomyces euteiches TaxID=100861 RepID=A0A6G0X3Y7_9STRA|nr:hypothetical protein Ae201684_008720 [Aphanomyces euteiches]
MQPLDWQNLSVDAYAAHFWDLRYLVRASEVFQREDSVWAALRKLLQSALKNGSPPSNTTVDDTIRTCLQTRLLRSSAFGTPDFYDTRAATINAATLNAPPSGHPPHYPSSATSAPPLTYQPTSLAAPTNSFLTPSSFFSPQAHAAPTQPAPAPSSGLELAPPPAQPAVPSYAHPACHSYTGPRPICYYCGIPGHNSNHCMTLLAHYMREPNAFWNTNSGDHGVHARVFLVTPLVTIETHLLAALVAPIIVPPMVPPMITIIATAVMIAATAAGSAAVLLMLVPLMALLLPILPLRWQLILPRYLLMYLSLLPVPPLHLLNRIPPHSSLILDHDLRIGPNPLLLDLPTLAGPYLLLDRRLLD